MPETYFKIIEDFSMSRYQPRFFDLRNDYRYPGERQESGERGYTVEPYIFSENVAIAMDVALATQRPILVAGKPGCGKSRLADAMAAILNWNFLSRTMTSRTRLEELTVEVDHLRRLNDANDKNTKALKPDSAYRNPGIFWWAFAPESARVRGSANVSRALPYPGTERGTPGDPPHTVLLIDEIDKAEPDVPNDLLEPLDRRSFSLPNGATVSAPTGQKLLTIITTNGERALPPAFLRRCVSLIVEEPTKADLVRIAEVHVPKADPATVTGIADRVLAFRDEAPAKGHRAPGTSEFLDAIRACIELKVSVDGKERSPWSHIERAILKKSTQA
jgi:MoxR-like ATPase